MGDGRWGESDTGGESAEYTETGGEGAYRKKRERRRARFLFGARIPDESRRGEKGRDHIIIEGNTYKPKIKGTESRGYLSLCSGMELHHPIMSKLGTLVARPKERKKERDFYYILISILRYS